MSWILQFVYLIQVRWRHRLRNLIRDDNGVGEGGICPVPVLVLVPAHISPFPLRSPLRGKNSPIPGIFTRHFFPFTVLYYYLGLA